MPKKIVSLLLMICVFLSLVPCLASDSEAELLLSYTFENDDENWIRVNNSTTGKNNTYIVDEASANGDRSLFINDTSVSANAGINSEYIEVEGQSTYTLLASGFAIKPKITMSLRFFDSNNKQILDENVNFSEKKWIEKGITVKAPDNATKARLFIFTATNDIVGGYIDEVKLYKGTVSPAEILNGKLPDEFPVIEEVIPDIEIFDDGYENGELIYFESFENGNGDWKNYDTSPNFDIIKNYSTNGNYSLYIKDTSTTKSIGAQSPNIKIAQGNHYTVYLDSYICTPGISLYAYFYDSANKELDKASLSYVAAGWQSRQLIFTAPAASVSMVVAIVGYAADLPEGYFDNIKVYKGNVIQKPDEVKISPPVQSSSSDSFIVKPSGNKLLYNAYNEQGDKLSDFSYAGFYGGKIELPDTDKLPVAMVLSPSGTDDDTEMIQDAIDKVYNESSDSRMKVIKLTAGKYYINSTGIKLNSGIVLSGEGQGPTGTIIYAKDPVSSDVITANGGSIKRSSDKISITDSYIKSGSKIITVEDSTQFSVGDSVCIDHPSSPDWIAAMQMQNVKNKDGNLLSWQDEALNVKTERVITEKNGNKLTLDHGLFIPYDKTYSQSYIYKIDDSKRVHDVGVENLRVVSAFNGKPYDNNHARLAIYVKRVKNMFVRNVTAKNMWHGVFGCREECSQITVENCSNIEPISTIEGGKRYPFFADIGTEKILFKGCYSYDGRHDYIAIKGTAGPVVFTDSIADMSNACSETHAEFATGVLFDNLYQISDKSNGYFAFSNRGLYGTDTPQGWTAAGCVAWNCLANSIIVLKPPLSYQNFTVGVWGRYDTSTSEVVKEAQIKGYQYEAYRTEDLLEGPDSSFATTEGTPMAGDGYKESEFVSVNPRSLYKAQLAARLTDNILNAKPNAPIIVYPRPDKEVSADSNSIDITGIYEMGAEEVSVYVDDIKYSAELNKENNSFKLNVELSEGVHKIYATQTFAKTEGNKTADRFIILGDKGSENPLYLQSNYKRDVTSLLLCDPRVTYDEYSSSEIELKMPEIAEITEASVTKYNSSYVIETKDVKNELTDGKIETNSSLIDYINSKKVKDNGLDTTENKNQHWLIGLDKVYSLTSLTLSYSFANRWVNFNVKVSEDKVNWTDLGTISPSLAATKENPVTIPLGFAKGKYIKLTLVNRNGTNAVSTETTTWGPNLGAGCSIALFEVMSVMGVADYSSKNFIAGYNKSFTMFDPFLANSRIYTDPSAIVFAKAVESYGEYSRFEYGILFSEKELSKEEFKNDSSVVWAKSENISDSSFYGIRFFGEKIKAGNTYYALPYAKYVNTLGEEITVTGEEVIPFVPEDK